MGDSSSGGSHGVGAFDQEPYEYDFEENKASGIRTVPSSPYVALCPIERLGRRGARRPDLA